ncbi:amidase [Vineibacter terrae]|uniref:amidase n=1 Tax=Vineibacter terrae TaxID=2586908 RepID=UPI002E32B9B3|nr:amidase [Vineibacter terrae]HEX2892102.1 amidase [Vineibacter terrae]
MSEIAELTLAELSAGLSRRQLSSRQVVDAFLARIDKADGKLHSFVEVYRDEARTLADAADAARGTGLPLGPLHGLPIALKDLCDIAGRVGTGGSKAWAARVATETSATAERLLAAGMIPMGKLHMVEWAYGGSGRNPLMGTPWNPWDLKTQRLPGGSSSGTGVAVAARLVPAGIGSDTGGSVRIPSAFNGIVGLKVTYGRISLHGTLLLSWTLDSIGPMARCVEDCALLLNALAGPDPRDPATLDQPLEDFTKAVRGPADVRGMRIALPDEAVLPSATHADVKAAWRAAARTFESLGARVETVRLPDWFFNIIASTTAISGSEAYSLHKDYIDDMKLPIGPDVRARVQHGRTIAPGAYAAELRLMAERRRQYQEQVRHLDALLMPTVPIPAAVLAEFDEMAPLPPLYTRIGNYLGLCGLAMPAGHSGGLPLSVQILGRPYQEATVLKLGKAFQDATSFHNAKPDLAAIGL